MYEDRLEAEEYLAWSKKWGTALVRTLKPNGTFWLAIGDDFAAELKMIFQRELGLFCRSWVIWYYTFGVHCKAKFSRSHTHLFHFVKDPKSWTFNVDDIRVPLGAATGVRRSACRSRKGGCPTIPGFCDRKTPPDSFTPEEDMWYVRASAARSRNAPAGTAARCPNNFWAGSSRRVRNPGETVLDPFGGSGTTLVVAKKLGANSSGSSYQMTTQKKLTRDLRA